MEMLEVLFTTTTILGGAFLIWLYTPKGKNGYVIYEIFYSIHGRRSWVASHDCKV